jgi:hypothetical protein
LKSKTQKVVQAKGCGRKNENLTWNLDAGWWYDRGAVTVFVFGGHVRDINWWLGFANGNSSISGIDEFPLLMGIDEFPGIIAIFNF